MGILRVVLALLLFSSCISSQKKLQRRIEKHGIKESIGFVQKQYPEYFKSKATTIHDTIIHHDTIIKEIHIINTVLQPDTNNIFTFEDEKVKVSLDVNTGEFEIEIKPDTIFYAKEIPIATKCPELICPDVVIERTKNNWFYIFAAFFIGLILIPLLTRVVS